MELPCGELRYWIGAERRPYVLECPCGAKFGPYQYLVNQSGWICPACDRKFKEIIKIQEVLDEND